MQDRDEKLVLVRFIDGTVKLVKESELLSTPSKIDYDAE